jgi:hypothetical protein
MFAERGKDFQFCDIIGLKRPIRPFNGGASGGARRRMRKVPLDTSATLALIRREPEHAVATEQIADAAVSAVNIGEVVGNLAARGAPTERTRKIPLASPGPFGLYLLPCHRTRPSLSSRTGTARPRR